MADTPKHSVSVAGIVVDDQDRVLVIKRRDNGRWEPPGGVLELPETFEDGVKREIFEETGISVVVERLTGVYKNLSLGVVALVFRCRRTEGRVHATSEASAVRWLSVHDAVQEMLPAYAVRISDAFTDEVNCRVHDGKNLIEAAEARSLQRSRS